MYAKVFAQIFDSSLRDKWQAWVVFVALLALADENDDVDMTMEALSARTGLPGTIVPEGIAYLENADQFSRTPDSEGRRIVRLDDHRAWGWHIVNRGKYRAIRDNRERREYMRVYQSNRRKRLSTPVNQGQPHVVGSSKELGVKKEESTPRSAAASLWDTLLRMELPDFLPREAWTDFVNHRRSLGVKGKLTERAARLTIAELQGLNDSGHPPGPVISQSVTNNWKGVFPIKNGVPNAPAETKPKTKRWTCTVCGKTGFSDDGGPDFRSCPDCEARYARH